MAKIDLQNVSVTFPIYNVHSRSFKKTFIRAATGGEVVSDERDRIVIHALKELTLSLRDGDRIGLIGHNGSGKSTFLRLLANIYEPTSGHLRTEGRVCPILDITHGIEAEFNGNENIYSRGSLLGLTRQEIKNKQSEIAALTGLGDYLTMPLRTYSSGMMVRLAFAVSASINPDILLIDEIFATGDADFMEKAREKMGELLNQSSIVVIATHSDELIREFCNKALFLEGGRTKYFGSVDEALKLYHAARK